VLRPVVLCNTVLPQATPGRAKKVGTAKVLTKFVCVKFDLICAEAKTFLSDFSREICASIRGLALASRPAASPPTPIKRNNEQKSENYQNSICFVARATIKRDGKRFEEGFRLSRRFCAVKQLINARRTHSPSLSARFFYCASLPDNPAHLADDVGHLT
jgi:hypothetical protein